MSAQAFVPIAFAGLIGWRMYRRIRRSIGRQPLQSRRAGVSVLIMSIIIVALIGGSLKNSALLAGSATGLAGGLLLGFFALRLTTFESGDAGHFYIPNTQIGVALSILLAGRIAYRVIAMQNLSGPGARTQTASPLTMAIAALFLGYYLAYSAGLFLRSRALIKTVPH